MEAVQKDRMHDLAARIYVELVVRNTEVSAEAVQMKASAANIAVLSLKLSEVFLEAEAEAHAARQPVKNFQLGASDISQWSK